MTVRGCRLTLRGTVKMVNRYCKCCHHMAGKPDAAANFYNDHFKQLEEEYQRQLEQEAAKQDN